MFVSFIVYFIAWLEEFGEDHVGGGGGKREREREEESQGFFKLPMRGGEGVRILLSLRGGIR